MNQFNGTSGFTKYYKKTLIGILFVFLPAFFLFSMTRFGLITFKIEVVSVDTLLPLLPFVVFLFVVVFLFNGAFWMGFFSENSSKIASSIKNAPAHRSK